jgi:DNA end-binding protein Ku
MLAHTMFFSTEVRSNDEYKAETNSVNEKELKLARTLIESLAGPFEPEKYRDTYREKLEALIATKVQGQSAVSPAAKTQSPARVADLMEALNQSLANLKKPAGSEQQANQAQVGASKPKKRPKSAS